jgi:hypothetical protein
LILISNFASIPLFSTLLVFSHCKFMIPDCRGQHALWEELAEIHMGFLFFSQKGVGGAFCQHFI